MRRGRRRRRRNPTGALGALLVGAASAAGAFLSAIAANRALTIDDTDREEKQGVATIAGGAISAAVACLLVVK